MGRGKLLPQSIGLACGGELGQLQPIHAVGAQGRSVSSTTESRPWDPFLYVFFLLRLLGTAFYWVE